MANRVVDLMCVCVCVCVCIKNIAFKCEQDIFVEHFTFICFYVSHENLHYRNMSFTLTATQTRLVPISV